MNSESEPNYSKPEQRNQKLSRLKIVAVILTVCGGGLFVYLVYSVGIGEIYSGVGRFGFVGFAVILFLYFLRIVVRAIAWSLSVYEPYKLDFRDTLPAVVIGEATSSIIPLGILISGTAKAVAVRHRVPLVAGLSSVATENLFYSLVTSIFLILGALTFLRSAPLEEGWELTIDALIAGITLLLALMLLMILRQWHFASETCEWLYQRGIGRRFLEKGRMDVRLFENLIYGFYRRYPRRFLPICGLEALYHAIGVVEVFYVLSRLGDVYPSLMTSFLLESVSRLITIMFKVVPLTIGVDEAGAQFVGEAFALAAGVGVTLAIIRKGRILFWTAIGLLLMMKRGMSLRGLATTNEGVQ